MLRPGGFGFYGAVLLLLTALFVLSLTPNEARLTKFFPQSLLDLKLNCAGTRDDPEFWEASYLLEMLDAAREPPLFEQSRKPNGRFLQTYRFSLERSINGRSVVVRLERQADGRLLMTAKQFRGPGYNPGQIEKQLVRFLSTSEQERFEAALNAADQMQLQPFICRAGGDGSRWFLEANDHGNYRFVDRWSPEDGPARDLGLVFMELTGWPPYETLRPIFEPKRP